MFLALAVGGCRPTESITQYTVAKEPVPPLPSLTLPEPSTSGELMRTIAAMVPQQEQTWYFKMTGPEKAVEAEMENFLRLVSSLKFDKAGGTQPSWELPEGWTEEPGSGMRFRTLKTGGDEPQEVSVIPLDGDATDDDYLLQNINRWRGQLGLPPKSSKTLFTTNTRTDEARRETLAGRSVVLVNFVGHAQPSDMGGSGGPPFAGRPPFAGGERPKPKTPPKALKALEYETPDGWAAGDASGMRKAAFTIADGGKSAVVTAMDLPAQGMGGNWLSNVNRWRGQLGLEATTEPELKKATRAVKVDGIAGELVELTGKAEGQPQSILAAMVVREGKAWFFKLQGDPGLAEREKAKFLAFLGTVRFAD